MILTALSVLARLGVLAASIIVLGLNGKFIQNQAWATGPLIYIEVIAAVSAVAAIIPPFPNFLFDLILFVALILAAIFALVVQVFESTCYGFRTDSGLSCAAYKAGTAFAFLASFAWLASAAFGGIRILGSIFKISSNINRPIHIGADRRIEDGKSPSNDMKKKIKGLGNNHIAKYFVCYGLLAVVLVAVGLAMLFLFAAPAFGEYLLARVPMPNVNITLSHPANNSISFTVTSNVTVPDRLKVNVDSTTISFYQEGPEPGTYPFAVTHLPRLTWDSNQRVGVENQTLILQNITEFTKLIYQVAYYPTFRVSGRARAKIHVGPLNTWVNLYKIVTLNGFNNFTGFDINKIGTHKPDANGYDVDGQVIVFNPAPASVTLGNMTLAVSVGGIQLGEAVVTVNNIVPGNNTINVKAKLNATSVRNNILPVLQTEMPYLRQELVVASASGLSVVYEGQHLPYWEKAFQALTISATNPVIPLLQLLVNGTLNNMLGENQFLSPILNALLGTLVSSINSIPEEDEAGFEEAVSSLGELIIRVLSNLGLI
ncbi:hypothetical protein BGW36DRAFT_426948 [Talaromyces proteolyticus]|uniref:MARVEL domain-containing protein n=1 Tax=Talaromyces proteolyticus TaxID=1131652 RepID=A0AAD4KVL3_9EURO|nr:uncharacterized protein BGW36DRAFT_426948 [Talaromyces proteolyticus]KAH8699279.1 hypothetical protein BGW36DRAFT_426948 [Talaromyces proteolyticus]